MSTIKVRDCWEHIAKYWDEEQYKESRKVWKEITTKYMITGDDDDDIEAACSGCDTKWRNSNYVCSSCPVCPCCDNNVQPFPSNPANRSLVLKYIPEKYHQYILEPQNPKSLKEICSDYFRKNICADITGIQWAMPKLYNEIIKLRREASCDD